MYWEPSLCYSYSWRYFIYVTLFLNCNTISIVYIGTGLEKLNYLILCIFSPWNYSGLLTEPPLFILPKMAPPSFSSPLPALCSSEHLLHNWKSCYTLTWLSRHCLHLQPVAQVHCWLLWPNSLEPGIQELLKIIYWPILNPGLLSNNSNIFLFYFIFLFILAS